MSDQQQQKPSLSDDELKQIMEHFYHFHNFMRSAILDADLENEELSKLAVQVLQAGAAHYHFYHQFITNLVSKVQSDQSVEKKGLLLGHLSSQGLTSQRFYMEFVEMYNRLMFAIQSKKTQKECEKYVKEEDSISVRKEEVDIQEEKDLPKISRKESIIM